MSFFKKYLPTFSKLIPTRTIQEFKARSFAIQDIISAAHSQPDKKVTTINDNKALTYYLSCSAIVKSINKIATELSSINIYLYDTNKYTFITNKEDKTGTLKFLNKPNPDLMYKEFMTALVHWYFISGNIYIRATGSTGRAPMELEILDPQYMEIIKSKKDSYVEEYKYKLSKDNELLFKRDETKAGFRFINENSELWHIKTFNPTDSCRGLSPLDNIYYEVEQIINSSVHNLSLLTKAPRLAGIITSSQSLQAEQRALIRNQLTMNYAGSGNAGSVMILDGSEFDYKDLRDKITEADFIMLREKVENAIYNNFDIPLPLVVTSSMTLNNYKEARLALYDNAVLPLLNRLCEELSHFLLPRFRIDTLNYKLFYDLAEIPALTIRRMEELKTKKEMNVLTINELRAELGYDKIAGGDTLYQPMSNIPLGTVIEESVSEPSKEPVKEDNDDIIKDDVKKNLSKDVFKKMLSRETDAYGNKLYTEEELNRIADEQGL